LLDLIASLFVRAVNIFFHVMPIRFNLWLGRRFGAMVYALSGKRGRITYANLKAAFQGEKTPGEIRRITKGVYRNASQTFAEILSMTKFDKRYIDKYVVVRNRERLKEGSKNPKGMILISAHFGNWELSTVTSVMIGFPLHLFVREQKMKRLDELLNMLRESKGSIVIRKGADAKNIFRVLHRGKSVGILADQNAGPNGELLDFFGRPASTAKGPYRFAQKSGAWILPAFIHRVKGPYHEIVVEKPMVIKKGEDVTPYMREYNRLLEKHIRAYPDQWLWMHKRWKMTPVKKVMVLDDGKKGHLRQSLAVVKQLKRYREEEGYSQDQTEVDIVGIRFKNKITKAIFNFLVPFFSFSWQGRLGCLRMALDRRSYDTAVSRYADVIVSCGSTLSGVNRVLKEENHARNVTVLAPGLLNRRKFDLVILPRHDFSGGRPGDNVVITDLAPNLIQGNEIASFKKEMEQTGGLKAMKKPCVGLLVGGDNPYFVFGEKLTRSVLDGARAACERLDGCLYATTSRRTPDIAEKILSEALGSYPRCVKFVSGRNDSDEHTVEKILAVSDIILVSGESISMVSEAISSGKPVLVFMPGKRKARHTKYERFVENLEQQGYLRRVKPEEISGEAVRAAGRKTGIRPADDNKRIRDKMYKLF